MLLHLYSIKKAALHAILAAGTGLWVNLRPKSALLQCPAYGAKPESSIKNDATVNAAITYYTETWGDDERPDGRPVPLHVGE
jgi:hypothetical protein